MGVFRKVMETERKFLTSEGVSGTVHIESCDFNCILNIVRHECRVMGLTERT